MSATDRDLDPAAYLRHAAQQVRSDTARTCHQPGRYHVDVAVLADAAARLGPVYDVLTATWPQAAYVRAMGPDTGRGLADLFDRAAMAIEDRGPDRLTPYFLQLAAAYLREPSPDGSERPDAPAGEHRTARPETGPQAAPHPHDAPRCAPQDDAWLAGYVYAVHHLTVARARGENTDSVIRRMNETAKSREAVPSWTAAQTH